MVRRSVKNQISLPNSKRELDVEYTWNQLLVFRTGYRFGIEEYTIPSAGVGIILPIFGPELRFDYGFSQLERLGNIHRVGVNLSL